MSQANPFVRILVAALLAALASVPFVALAATGTTTEEEAVCAATGVE